MSNKKLFRYLNLPSLWRAKWLNEIESEEILIPMPKFSFDIQQICCRIASASCDANKCWKKIFKIFQKKFFNFLFYQSPEFSVKNTKSTRIIRNFGNFHKIFVIILAQNFSGPWIDLIETSFGDLQNHCLATIGPMMFECVETLQIRRCIRETLTKLLKNLFHVSLKHDLVLKKCN